MNSRGFLDAFRHIANAPGGIARLRELILQLAISGSLVVKDDNDTSVETSLAEARRLQADYTEAFELRKVLPHSSIEKYPFAIPSHWAWERLERLCLYIQRGKGPTYVAHSSTRVISQKCIQWWGFDLAPSRFISDDAVDGYGPERRLRQGDLLWNSTGTGTAGRIAKYDTEESVTAVADSHVTVIRLANFEPQYVWCVIAAPWVQSRINPDHPKSLVSGTTQQVELATSAVRALEIPCPPIEEQKRIVAKVNELMALCDQLQKLQEARQGFRTQTRQALIQRVASAPAPFELVSGWKKLTAWFPDLFKLPVDVSELRTLVFDLAVRGLLVEQSESDEKISTILETAKRERGSSATKRKPRSTGHLPDIEAPFSIPQNWSWHRLGELAYLINGDRGKNYPKKNEYVSSGVPWINAGHIQADGTLCTKQMNFIRREKFETLNSGKIQSGDLLYCLRGALGKVAFVDPYNEGAIASSLVIVRPVFPILSKYIYYYLISSLGKHQITIYDNGTAQPNLSAKSVGLFMVPVPPLAEQKRIVQRIVELLRHCSKLEQQFSQAEKIGESLARDAVSSITGIAAIEEEAELKAPQTELIAPLRIGKPPVGSAQAPLASILVRHSGALSAKDLWQRFGGEIDGFYAQLKHEVAQGWIVEPEVAEMRERESA